MAALVEIQRLIAAAAPNQRRRRLYYTFNTYPIPFFAGAEYATLMLNRARFRCAMFGVLLALALIHPFIEGAVIHHVCLENHNACTDQ